MHKMCRLFHVSGAGKEYYSRLLDIAMLNLGGLEKGQPLISLYQRGQELLILSILLDFYT